MSRSARAHEAFFDIHPVTGAMVEVFYADRSLETFGWHGGGWFWCRRKRGFAPDGAAVGPFPTGYSAYRDALGAVGFAARCCTTVELPLDARGDHTRSSPAYADAYSTDT